ncbi:MAG: helix-turn-helix domain-containing protein [Spirochaetales bacterium]|nr:helix-turn-helix domain-containing protein [Spirochaetales bacterium]
MPIRLAEAKRLLKETDIMISEIASQVDFHTIPHFNRIFKDNEKVSPKDFRNRAIPLLPEKK